MRLKDETLNHETREIIIRERPVGLTIKKSKCEGLKVINEE